MIAKGKGSPHFYNQDEGVTSNWMLVAYPVIMNLPKKLVNALTGRTLKDWIAYTLTVEIKYHLTCTDKTIEEISEDLSFCSTSAFIQYFKSKTGCTPFKYRRDQNLKTQ